MNYLLRATQLALDLAAPVEGTVAPLHHEHGLGPVPSAAAHEVAAVDTDTRVVAGTPVRTGDAQPRVLLAETRR